LQLLFAQQFKGGLTGGLIVSQVDGDNWGGYNKPGVNFGGFVYVMFKKNVGFGTELKYIQKGSFKAPNYEKGDYTYYKMRLSYIEMPFLAKYVLNEKLNFDAGLGISYLFKATEDKDGNGGIEAAPPFFKYEIPFICSVHYQMSEKVEVFLRFSYSVLPIRNHPGDHTYFLDRGQCNKLLNLSFNYTF